jgi:hypothetical protein
VSRQFGLRPPLPVRRPAIARTPLARELDRRRFEAEGRAAVERRRRAEEARERRDLVWRGAATAIVLGALLIAWFYG